MCTGEESEIELSTSWSSCESDLRGHLTNDEGGDLGDDELSDWPDYDDDHNQRGIYRAWLYDSWNIL